MPYPGVPAEKTAKMDSCVRRVRKTGKSKDSAIAICHDAVVGKKKGISESEWLNMNDEQAEQVIDEVLSDDSTDAKEKTADSDTHEKSYVPFGVTSFKQLDEYRKAQEQAQAVFSTAGDFSGLIDSIMYDDNVKDKGKAVRSLADEFAGRIENPPKSKAATVDVHVDEAPLLQRIISAVADVFGIAPKAKDDVQPKENDSISKTAMMIWKEDDGSYRWMARYSNNFRDDDNPPEIISEKSHRRFVEKVDSGEYDLPELWLWHRPEWKCGKAAVVAYDDSGFAVASGYFDKGKEYVAEWLSKQSDVAVSHAMPSSSIVRDTTDPSVIVEHRTIEISPLPLWAAANKLTGFIVLDATKEADMAIPEKKRDAFVKEWGFDPSLLDKLEQQNAQDAQKAASEGRESKEQSEAVADEAQGQAVENTQASGEDAEGSEKETAATSATSAVQAETLDQSPSRREIAEAFGSILSDMKEAIDSMNERVAGMESVVKELKKSDDEKVKETTSQIPAASLAALLAQRVVGRQETAVDGRSSLAKSKPEEAPTAPANRIGIPFIDRMVGETQDKN